MKYYQRLLGVMGICLAFSVQPTNFSLITIAMPTIQKELGASLLQLQWMLNMFGIVISIFLVTMGRLADTFGRKRLFLIGMLMAAISSCMSGFAVNPGMIIAAQGLMGLAGSILMPVAQALISHSYPAEEKGKAIGIWATTAGLALAFGPFIGGSVIQWLWLALYISHEFTYIGFRFRAGSNLCKGVQQSPKSGRDRHPRFDTARSFHWEFGFRRSTRTNMGLDFLFDSLFIFAVFRFSDRSHHC